ncbi:cytochrome b-c1 complex subunit 7 [Folsomia candida]|uniref:cytochrome b-c1 complex subunit 7 n=1 Tax=Folsomia candida TaxID=158441 RepID=UPI000B8F01E7|nr:cytochrome b-c1 complex subunit 7 [Folsomia candida]
MAAAKGLFPGLKRWAWNYAGFNKYGLKFHDCLNETPEVVEALRRLPANVVDERNFRIIRAMQLSMQKIYLPKEEWLTFEQDDYYLKPYLEEVEREFKEREEWRKK